MAANALCLRAPRLRCSDFSVGFRCFEGGPAVGCVVSFLTDWVGTATVAGEASPHLSHLCSVTDKGQRGRPPDSAVFASSLGSDPLYTMRYQSHSSESPRNGRTHDERQLNQVSEICRECTASADLIAFWRGPSGNVADVEVDTQLETYWAIPLAQVEAGHRRMSHQRRCRPDVSAEAEVETGQCRQRE